MASITLTGTLLDPSSKIAIGDEIRFTNRSTTGSTIKSAQSLFKIGVSGTYVIELQYGLIFVEYKDSVASQFSNLGVVTVNQDSTATTLPELLNAVVPPTDAQLLEFQTILANCVSQVTLATTQAVRSEAAASVSEAFANQLTTTELIASTAIYAADVNLGTSGFTTSGDGGSGNWKQNGVTGQTPSQSPAQLGNALLNDASGNQWGLVVEGWVNIETLGAKQSVDSTLEIQAAFNSCEWLYATGFDYRYTTLTVSNNLKFIGGGKKVTRLRTTNLTEDKIVVNSTGSFIVHDMAFSSIGVQTGGAYFKFAAATQIINPSFHNCDFVSPYVAINFTNANTFKISGCYFVTYVNAAVIIDNQVIPDSGDSTIEGGCVFDAGGNTGTAILQISSGGLRAVNNKFLNGAYHYRGEYSSAENTSVFVWTGNSSEQARLANMSFNAVSPNKFSKININGGNQYSVRAGATGIMINNPGYDYLSSVNISDNVLSLDDASVGINTGRLQMSTIGKNTMTGNGTGEFGIIIPVASSNITLDEQTLISVSNEYSDLSTTTNYTGWGTKKGTEVALTNTAFGSMYISLAIPIVFASEFPSIPAVNASPENSGGAVSCLISNTTKSGFTLHVVGLNNAASTTSNWEATL